VRGRRAAVAAVAIVAAALWIVSWAVLQDRNRGEFQIVDTPVYQGYGDAMRRGEVPYRDFELEYPPAALPAFVAPELTTKPGDYDSYTRAFERWLAGLGVFVILLVAVALAAAGETPSAIAAATGFVVLTPPLLGSVYLTRFDLWPAALSVGAIAALVGGLDLVAAVVLALAVGAKIYPAVLVPLGLAWVWRRRGRRRAVIWSVLLIGTLAAIFLPFAIISPGGVEHSLRTQLERPLQIESLGSSLLLWAHHVFGLGLTVHSDHGSQNIAGSLADGVGVASSVLQVVAVVTVWVLFARGPARADRLFCASAAAVAALIAFSKVFSPQFAIWLVPLVPLVRGRRGIVACGLCVVALLLTQFWFPSRYWQLANELDRGVSGAVLARDLAVLTLALVLIAGLRVRQTRSSPT
jgi:Glycosyltransferase family 87